MTSVNSYLYRMPAGIPGDVTRLWDATIEPASVTPVGTTGAPTAYGVPMIPDATTGNVGNMRTMTTGDARVYGLLVRPFPTGATQDALGVSTPPASGQIDILRSGYMSVILSGSVAAAKGGLVYIWLSASTGSHIRGGFEAADPTSDGIAYTGATFVGPADASNITEIAVYP